MGMCIGLTLAEIINNFYRGGCWVEVLERLRKYIYENLLAFAKKSKLPSHQVFSVCARGKQNPAGDAFEVEKGSGDVRDYNIRTAAAVVPYDTSTRFTYSSLGPLIPGATYLVPGTVHASTQQTIQIRGTGVCLARKNPL